MFAYGSCLFLGGRIQDTSNSKTKFDFDGKVYTYGRLVWCDRECFNAFVTLNNRYAISTYDCSVIAKIQNPLNVFLCGFLVQGLRMLFCTEGAVKV